MRIAYITLHQPRTLISGVGKKINNQIRTWREFGHTVQLFSHLHHVDASEKLIDGQRFYYENNKNLISTEWSRIAATKHLLRSVRKYCPDVIYLRWSMYVHPMKNVFSLAPTIIEVNTNDYEEHKLLGFTKNHYNRLTRSILLGNAAGHVYVSNGLTNDPKFTKFKKPFTAITNGIDLKSTPFYPAPNNPIPRLIFIGTPGRAWHGVEKLVLFARHFSDIIIDIVGYDSFECTTHIPPNIIFHGYQQGEQYEKLLSSADAAIGTLSLHLRGIEKASTLKAVDYAARGIPCILPYNNTDLSGLDCLEILNIPNTPDNITTHGAEIHDFVKGMRGKRIPRELVVGQIDSSAKEAERLAFFEHILRTK